MNIQEKIKQLAAEQKIAKNNRKSDANVITRTMSQSDAACIHHYNREKLRYLHAALWVKRKDGDFSELYQIDKNWKEVLSKSKIESIIQEYV